MDSERWRRIDGILDVALDLSDRERTEFLDDVCSGDEVLRREVDELLRAADSPAGFLAAPAADRAAPLVADVERDRARAAATFLIGRLVGPYRLVRELGEGGMGIVYLAERVDGHFDQEVAVKLAKQSMFTEEARRRFVQERQILASLDHPSIARLLDGGVTSDGIPYFVMERVDGRPVTAYCDERKL